MNNTKKLGAAIIGCGTIFPLHAKALANLQGVELLAVADNDLSKAEQKGLELGCSATDDYRTIVERDDIDVVHLCTPHHLHAEMAIELLKAGKHVLTEKPLAANLDSARRMLEAAANSKGQLGVVFQNRYNDPSVHIKQTIESGELGRLICLKGVVTWHRDEVYYRSSNWRGRWATEGGGVLMNQTIHTLDLLQWFGGNIATVQGSVTTDVLDGVIEVEDSAHACIEFSNKARALFYGTNAYLVNSPVELEVVFEHGTLLQRRDSLYLWKDEQETLICDPASRSFGAKSYWGTGHFLLIEDFYNHIRENRRFWIDGEEGFKALKLAMDIYSSSKARS
ncbi:Gfo/Idh/MocA family protein [Paenibacillus macquariensis]|uniref:Predicted dehydrogenase n=1 Tax=Paenibacillus macquariensis TaxID=948756 RepID=A0ABY1JW54_9BACL|nr:Gfo/Idh/MocA family oxidoreductase [Paenibacillus macquariensis]MEC0090654.1 Gfo/Idh/MocA family oxidoreductase [Paenibacillus macquariensis]OAB34409.1 oxidoreductase [Paenibacillus macquariensis subsp. macquariensis]SIQ87083.1 Predicted dehydrogenase [Paenibacillus macquariensis]